jgi:hypothetical protein
MIRPEAPRQRKWRAVFSEKVMLKQGDKITVRSNLIGS